MEERGNNQMRRLLVVLIVCLGLALGVGPLSAGPGAVPAGLQKKKPKKPKKKLKKKKKHGKKGKKKKHGKKPKKAPPRRAGKASIPVQIGIGPAVHMITGPVQADQLLHFGLKTYKSAIIDNETIRANKNMIPKKFRSSIMKAREIRISPMVLALIPDTIFISPKYNNTQMYGAVFRPIGIGIAPLSNNWFRFDVNAGLLAMYAFLESDNPKIGKNHLLDIGLDAKAAVEFKGGHQKRFLARRAGLSPAQLPFPLQP